jgi:hypothetical protein
MFLINIDSSQPYNHIVSETREFKSNETTQVDFPHESTYAQSNGLECSYEFPDHATPDAYARKVSRTMPRVVAQPIHPQIPSIGHRCWHLALPE